MPGIANQAAATIVRCGAVDVKLKRLKSGLFWVLVIWLTSCACVLYHIISYYHIIVPSYYSSDYGIEFWNDKIDVFKYQSNRSFRGSHLLAFAVSWIAIQLYSVGWQRCLPQRPRTGGWKKNAKGWWLGGSEWRVDRQHVLVAMICLDLNLKEYKRLSIDCMSFDDSFFGGQFFSLIISIYVDTKHWSSPHESILPNYISPKRWHESPVFLQLQRSSIAHAPPSTRAIPRRKPSKSFGALEKSMQWFSWWFLSSGWLGRTECVCDIWIHIIIYIYIYI